MARDDNQVDLETFVEAEGSNRVRAFALDWEFQHARNSDRFPIFLTLPEWEQEFNSYMAEPSPTKPVSGLYSSYIHQGNEPMSYKECPQCKQPLIHLGDRVVCRNGDFEYMLPPPAQGPEGLQDDSELARFDHDNGDYLDRKYSRFG